MEPGYRIEHYVIIEKIGQGGQAAVWSAHDERLKRTVAIKTIGMTAADAGASSVSGTAPAGASNLTNPDRFREEAEIIAALEHPNILPVYAFGQDGDYLYIVMRYMASGSLKDLVRQKQRLTVNELIPLMEPLASALDLAHQNKIIHRDLKSANVLLDAHQNPYLADFGLSMTMGDKNSVAGVGTLAYMSPEQMMGEELDPRSDLYAFGILLFELLVGQLPNIDGQPWNLQQTMSNAPMPIPDDVPEPVASILRKATALRPEERFSSASDIMQALRAAAAAQGPSTQEAEPEPELIITDPAILALFEAHDLFNRARERWSDGAGRFRFEAGDFKYVDGYYSAAADWDLELDDMAKRLMLRAALEHGYNADYWWEQVADIADRRAVALQTLTSDLAPARMRAMQRLATIEDSDPPAIPIRVANVIGAEPDADVRLAGIDMLVQRAELSRQWRYAAFNEAIDGTLAELAVHDPDPGVADAAARACARLRSSFAVRRIAKEAGEHGPFAGSALQALMNVRDEVPAFPDGVPAALRQRAFIGLSRRQLFADPLGLIGRYAGAAIGFGIGLGTIVYSQFNDPGGLLAAQRIGNALAVGALYGALVGVGVLAATEPAERLRAWTRPGRILLAWALGTLLTTVAFVIFHRYFLFINVPDWKWLLGTALVFVAGFAIASGLTRRPWIRSVAGAVGALAAVWFSWQIGQYPLIYFGEGQDDQSLLLSIWLAAALGVLTFLPEWIRAIRRLNRQVSQA
jgi:hypothetical protein